MEGGKSGKGLEAYIINKGTIFPCCLQEQSLVIYSYSKRVFNNTAGKGLNHSSSPKGSFSLIRKLICLVAQHSPWYCIQEIRFFDGRCSLWIVEIAVKICLAF